MGRWEEPRFARGREGDEGEQEPYCDVPMVENTENVNHHTLPSTFFVSDFKKPAGGGY